MTIEEQRNLFRDACRVVEHLGKAIGECYGQIGTIADSADERTCEALTTAAYDFMQALGDLMSNHDMVEDGADEWVNPIYERVRLWDDERTAARISKRL